jgi:DNA-binding transcriptional MerR regulator/quercetin dioxygenase-like cupin family protein
VANDDDSAPASVYIKQAAQMVGVSAAKLREWEREALVHPQRSGSGYRLYTLDDIRRLRQIRDLIQREGFNPAGVRHVLDSPEDPHHPPPQERQRPPSQLGVRLKRLRTEQGASLRELAARTGLSASYISSLERSRSTPSVASLQKLASALGTNLDRLLGDDAREATGTPVVHPRQGRRLNLEVAGVTIEQLATTGTQLEPSLLRVAPGSGSGDSYHHEGEEFLYVLEGVLEITLEESTTYLMRPHDSITFESHIPHRWRNPGGSETAVIWVNTPPTF